MWSFSCVVQSAMKSSRSENASIKRLYFSLAAERADGHLADALESKAPGNPNRLATAIHEQFSSMHGIDLQQHGGL